MRWDALFADLEARADGLAAAERAAQVDERTRIEVGALGLRERLLAAVGDRLRFSLAGSLTVTGTVDRVGPDWLLVAESGGREAVLCLRAVHTVSGLGRRSATPGSDGIVAGRLTLRHALRGLARDRSAVRVHLVDGTVTDATLDRVGLDFVEAARHAAGEPRRRAEVRDVQVIALSALAAVRRDSA
jgi:hypothetical protein